MTEGKSSWFERLRGGGKKELQQLCEKQQAQILSLEEEMKQLLADLNTSREEQQRMEALVREKSRQIEESRKETAQSQDQELMMLREANQALSQELEDGRSIVDRQKATIIQHKNDKEELRKMLAEAESEREKLKSLIGKQEQKMREFQAVLEGLSDEVDKREALLQQEKKSGVALNQKLQETGALQKRVAELEALLEESTQKAAEESKQRKALEGRLESVSEMESAFKESEKVKASVAQEREQLAQDRAEKEAELKALQKAHKALQKAHDHLSTEIEASKGKGGAGMSQEQQRLHHVAWACAVEALSAACGQAAPLALWRASQRLVERADGVSYVRDPEAFCRLLEEGGWVHTVSVAEEKLKLSWQPKKSGEDALPAPILQRPALVWAAWLKQEKTNLPSCSHQQDGDTFSISIPLTASS